MNSPSPPAAPDPGVVAQKEAAANKDTAITQARLNAVNQISPQGSVTFDEAPGADGTPKFTQTTTLSPDQQKLYDQNTQLGAALNDLAIGQTGRIKGVLDTPLDLNGANGVEGKIYDLGARRLDPRFAQEQAALESRLANQGILRGTEAFNREMDNFNQTKNDAYDQLALTGRQQALTELLAQRNQPINEITALMSGGQVSMPNAQPMAPVGVAPTDVAGAFGLNQAAQNAAFGAKANATAGNNAAIGGTLATAASAAAIIF